MVGVFLSWAATSVEPYQECRAKGTLITQQTRLSHVRLFSQVGPVDPSLETVAVK
jgi:hypothetical protein